MRENLLQWAMSIALVLSVLGISNVYLEFNLHGTLGEPPQAEAVPLLAPSGLRGSIFPIIP